MASPEAGQSTPVKEAGDQSGAEKDETVTSPASKEEAEEGETQEPEEECAVCRNDMIDATTLSDCIHMFCYDCIAGWITKGSGTFCPMCKAKVTSIRRRDTGEVTTVAQLKASTTPAPVVSRDLITEKRMVARKMRSCRRLMNKLDELISLVHRGANDSRQEELVRMKQLVVAQLNALQMVREDIESGALKPMVVSKAAFRRLIYERRVEAGGIATEGLPTRQEILDNIEHFRTVFHNFMSVELKALPTKLQMRVDNENGWHFTTVHDELHGTDETIIGHLFDAIVQHGAADLRIHHIETALNGMISLRVAGVLHNEICSLLTSRLTYLGWCGAVYYRSDLDRGGEANDHEVVVVDDNGDDPPAQDFSRRRFAPFDGIFGLGQPSILFNRRDDAPLRMAPFAGFRPQAHVVNPSELFTVPRAGIPWEQLAGVATRSRTTASRRPEVVNLDDDDEEDIGEPISNSSPSGASDDVQVVDHDGTIVLGDTPDTRPGPSRLDRARGAKRRNGDEQRASKRAKTDVPAELVADVKKLIDKFAMPTREALNMMVDATQEALEQKRKALKEEEVDVETISNSKTP